MARFILFRKGLEAVDAASVEAALSRRNGVKVLNASDRSFLLDLSRDAAKAVHEKLAFQGWSVEPERLIAFATGSKQRS